MKGDRPKLHVNIDVVGPTFREVKFYARTDTPWGPVDCWEVWPDDERGINGKAFRERFKRRAEQKLLAYVESQLAAFKRRNPSAP